MPFSDWCISILCNRTPLNFFIVRSVQPKRFCHFEFLSWGVFFYSRCTCYFSPCLLRVLRTWSNELWTFLKRFSGNFWILDFEKHVYVRTTNSITAIVTEWIFYGLPLFTGFDFWIWLSQDYWILLSTNQELLLRILFQVLSSKARWMESI